MGSRPARAVRAIRVDPRRVDALVALCLTTVGLAGVPWHRTHGAAAIAVGISSVAATAGISWRRRWPGTVVMVGIGALIVFQAAAGHAQATVQPLAVSLDCYLVARSPRRGRQWPGTAVLASGLVAVLVISMLVGDLSLVGVAGRWAFGFVVPYALGMAMRRRAALRQQLQETNAALAVERELRARDATRAERARIARELHDVIAHDLSVMVIQTQAARRVARRDCTAASQPVGAVVEAGREALVELRRITGVVRRGDDDSLGEAPGLSQLGTLVERTRAAGLSVELHADLGGVALPAGVDLVAYRVVQEALTNTLKHAGPVRAVVRVSVDRGAVEVDVSDNGVGGAGSVEQPGSGSGHGLVGMRERVELYGGQLDTEQQPQGGYAVRARIPLAEPLPLLDTAPDDSAAPSTLLRRALSRARVRAEVSLAALALIALEVEAVMSTRRHGPLALNVLVVGLMAAAARWRRRWPLGFVVVVGAAAVALSGGLTSFRYATLAGAYTVLLPTYTVAAWERRERAIAGLAVWVGGAAIAALANHAPVGNFIPAVLTAAAAWAGGRTMDAERAMSHQLEDDAARLASQRERRALVAASAERTRVARDLHAFVARTVAAMVVQGQLAQRLMNAGDTSAADDALERVERGGREALVQMRRILGVLRHGEQAAELQPQPGLTQLRALVNLAQQDRQISLDIRGPASDVPASIALGIFRIVQEVLESSGDLNPRSPVAITVTGSSEAVELRVTAAEGAARWPTTVARERAALGGGTVQVDSEAGMARLVARFPRAAGVLG